MNERGQHLHVDDYPNTLRLLAELLESRTDRASLGYSPMEHGAWVDWDGLISGVLSSTQKAVVHVARGRAVLERHGGTPPHIAGTLREVVDAVS